MIDPEWLTQTRPTAISVSAESWMSAKFEPETENNVRRHRKWLRTTMISSVAQTLWLAGFGTQTGLVNNLEMWANLIGAEISPVC